MRLDARVLARQARQGGIGEARQAGRHAGSGMREGKQARGRKAVGSSSWQDIIFAPNESQQFRISLSLSLSRRWPKAFPFVVGAFYYFVAFAFGILNLSSILFALPPLLTLLLLVLLPFKPINELKIFYANECECF